MEEELQALKKVLDGPDAPEIITALTRLEAVPMTVALIESTQIGVSVGKLRRHSSAAIAEKSKTIVNSWRGLLKPGSSPAPSPASSNIASARDSGNLKRSNSEVNDDLDGKKSKAEAAESKTEEKTKKTKSSTDLEFKKAKSSDADTKLKSDESGEMKRAKSEKAESKSPAQKPANTPQAKETDEEARSKCRGMLEEALATPPLPSAEGAKPLQEVASGIEEALFAAYDGLSKEYRARFRTLFLNLKNPKNTELRLHLYYGELPFDKLVKMSSDELAPRELQEEKARIAKWQRDAITRSVDAGSATDLFRCSKCQQRKCTYFQMQTRSADEPMTSFITCLNCGNRWKMN